MHSATVKIVRINMLIAIRFVKNQDILDAPAKNQDARKTIVSVTKWVKDVGINVNVLIVKTKTHLMRYLRRKSTFVNDY